MIYVGSVAAVCILYVMTVCAYLYVGSILLTVVQLEMCFAYDTGEDVLLYFIINVRTVHTSTIYSYFN